MKEHDRYLEVMTLKAQNVRIVDIVRQTGLTRSCVNNWVNRGSRINERILNNNGVLTIIADPIEYIKSLNPNNSETDSFRSYSFILGLYFGDGCISRTGRSKQLSIALDKKYPGLNEYVIYHMSQLFNKNPTIYDRSIDRGQKYKSNCINIKYSNKNLGIIFPHEGVGKKYERSIRLEKWQLAILDHVFMLKGLFFSDGCYYYDRANKKFMYSFTNKSKDIVDILCNSLNEMKIRYNIRLKCKEGVYIVTVKYQEDVSRLHILIGDKNF
jgi:hypothetical protein